MDRPRSSIVLVKVAILVVFSPGCVEFDEEGPVKVRFGSWELHADGNTTLRLVFQNGGPEQVRTRELGFSPVSFVPGEGRLSGGGTVTDEEGRRVSLSNPLKDWNPLIEPDERRNLTLHIRYSNVSDAHWMGVTIDFEYYVGEALYSVQQDPPCMNAQGEHISARDADFKYGCESTWFRSVGTD